MILKKVIWTSLIVVLIPACASFSTSPQIVTTPSQDAPEPTKSIQPLAVSDRIAWPNTRSITPVRATETLYTFAAKNLPIQRALKLFSQAYKLNLVTDEDVIGNISVDFYDLPFAQAMAALLDSLGYYWVRKGDLIHVRSTETQVFVVDYIRLVRSGSSSSQAKVTSGSSDDSTGSESDSEAGAITIAQENKVSFWDELEEQVGALKSEQGRLVINRLAGTIQITDQHQRVTEIGQYIKQLNRAIYRQVDIEVKIVEVTLNDDFSFGIDWSRLANAGQPGRNRNFNISNLVDQPAGGLTALDPALDFVFSRIGDDGSNRLTGILTALREQGDVKIVSQPRIRTLNNQSALIKVGTDRTFFRREQLTDTTTAGSQILSTDVPQVVTEGIVLAITPQISLEGWITLDVSPVITRVSSVSEVLDDNGTVLSSAPNLDISQASSLVRARSGETIVIGGLIQTTKSNTQRGVPLLSRIPGLGYLFKGNYNADIKRELVMFVTPKLIDDSNLFGEVSSLTSVN